MNTRIAWVLAGMMASCGGDTTAAVDDGAPTDVAADAVTDAASTDDAVDDAATTDATSDDATDDALTDAATEEVAQDAQVLDVPIDRACQYDPRYGNTRDPELRCRPCRSMVGIIGDEVQVALLWWAEYSAPIDAPDLCAGIAEPCSAKVVEAEVLLCKNLGTGKTRVLWNDLAEVVKGSGDAAVRGEARGPLGGLLLGDVRAKTAPDVPFETAAPTFVPSEWVVRPKTGGDQRVRVDVGRNTEECPVGKITLGGDVIRLGVIQPCQKTFAAYGGD